VNGSEQGALALLLMGIGVVLLIGELLLPTHGLLGLLAGMSVLTGVGVCFLINPLLGLGVLIGVVVASPAIAAGFLWIWPKTPIGKRLVLQQVTGQVTPPALCIGQTGVTISELRPWGECEFGDLRVEAMSEHGILPAHCSVKVVALSNGHAVVRPVETTV
jgi:membrane-bound ClpP family serine protease